MKTKFKGTPKDWYIVNNSIDSDLGTIAMVWHSEDEENKANALLISKAPELLQMLESIVRDFESDYVLDGEIVDSPYEWLQDRYKEAKQLIEEAKQLIEEATNI